MNLDRTTRIRRHFGPARIVLASVILVGILFAVIVRVQLNRQAVQAVGDSLGRRLPGRSSRGRSCLECGGRPIDF
jgi:hypothetical protein